jgi:hypothetical protein
MGFEVRFDSKETAATGSSLCFPKFFGALEHVRYQVDYSITSSARPSSGRGTVTPSALAVFKLMTSSTFVAC